MLSLFPKLTAKLVGIGVDCPQSALHSKKILKTHVTNRNLLFIGRVEKSKGVEVLLEAWAAVIKSGWNLILVGPCDIHYKNFLLKKWPLLFNESAVFFGAANKLQKEDLFNNSSALILPSYSENFGLVVAEALIRGVPVITTDQTPWVIDSKDSGCFISKAGDINDLAKVLVHLISLSSQEIIDIGSLGSKYAREKFSWDCVVDRLPKY